MKNIEILDKTIDQPISFIGEVAGICYNSDTTDDTKNFKRGIDCLERNHGRTLEYPKVYMVISGYSAKVIRELYTHIIDVSRLQESTRYVNYDNFGYITPQSVYDLNCESVYSECMEHIREIYRKLLYIGLPKEDASMILPLGMKTKMVWCIGLRELIDFMSKRTCSRAFWEIRDLCEDIKKALKAYTYEWDYIVDEYFKTKCIKEGKCTENPSCGKYLKESIC